ncbi:virulence factor family protein [Terrihabitans rhizophilus]|uniref:AcvB/VirJ family lysyl-phosphatidylglycerol hydrolase n=1 Tax=Terrihabitans rhizophilus TaxID=3092662 RepID=A0ABU4RIJ7_9HYPH|nr:AcvB/VirJ family lysyl-phosphatidylglycerol hydrolase [Terrihabitans sp. PJ23]MDX6804650.1 AcvB/VirJ family lysyl-phosphatidylglycerol hydrolase [Terrihabitans sp. PJ23]
MRRLFTFLLVLALNGPAFAQETSAPPRLDTGLLGSPLILTPSGVPKGVAFLFSGADGWGTQEQRASELLQAGGMVVVGINLPDYKARLDTDDGECLYLVSDIEGVSYQIQRELGVQTYHSPQILGLGAGGGLVLSIAQQTPAATIGEAIAVDAQPAPSLKKPLCGPDSTPPDMSVKTIRALSTTDADAASRRAVADIVARGVRVDLSDAPTEAGQALANAALEGLRQPSPAEDRLAGLPLVELPASKPSDTMAVVLSGDGGWRDLDKTIAEAFQNRGVSTVGVDSLRYFWSERKPAEVAQDLRLIIERYSARWKAGRVLLVGYSFGADVLPEVYNLLPPETRKMIPQLSLLGFAAQATYEISVAGWLGQASETGHPSLPQLERVDPAIVQCIYGREEEDSACPALADKGIEMIRTEGGHHFDENYEALAEKILAGADRRR